MKKRSKSIVRLRHIMAVFCVVLMGFLSLPFFIQREVQAQSTYIASRSFLLSKRYGNEMVSDVMKKNILLTLAYERGLVRKGEPINWDLVQRPFFADIDLSPGTLFSFHEDVLDKYKNLEKHTLNAHFNSDEGFISDGYLVGDGVCHLASLIYWAAKDAGLAVEAPTNHDFAVIPEISREYGVSIYYDPGNFQNNALQNLYIQNNKNKTIQIEFTYNGDRLAVNII